MQSKKFVDGTVSPKLNFRALAEKVIEKNKSVVKKLGKKKNKVKPVEAVAVKGVRLKSTVVSNKNNTGEKKRVDWGGFLNNLVTTAGATVTGVFASKHAASQPQIQQAPAPAAPAAPSGNEDNKEKDNTMLYAGIGGAVLLVVILLVMLKK